MEQILVEIFVACPPIFLELLQISGTILILSLLFLYRLKHPVFMVFPLPASALSLSEREGASLSTESDAALSPRTR